MRRIRMGMVGGGPGAFIGNVHRMAARLDGQIELVAGCFSRDPAKSQAAGRELFLDPARVYPDYDAMFARETALPEDERIDFVSIVTPNAQHFPVAMAALEAGFHVVCDKPMTLNVAEAEALAAKVRETGLLFCLTHNYTAYPMIAQAKAMIAEGQLGKVRKVLAEYPQGWLAAPIDAAGNKQAAWRTDPAQAGGLGCYGDIGSHAENLAEYVTGLKIADLCADLHTFVPGRRLDDDGSVLVRFDNGARGVITASQIAVGEENALSLRVYGEKGGLEWRQEEPNTLVLKWNDRPRELYRTGWAGCSAAAANRTRIPAGHSEGFLEAFAVLYRNFALAIQARLDGTKFDRAMYDFPDAETGLRGMKFLAAVLASANRGAQWTRLED
ncbi:hypothetical protein SDC9_78291 [bioreactor metagenome]|uniref:Uncharacterized protein n=1 Tax=bioreactor metagenome TaxID=1076179 RepID=A0A644Z0L1_9ZZZZ